MIENFKLKVFRVVAERLNYRRAAEELHLTQPAVSAQIHSLEEKLGITLFDRIGRETSLTEAGATLLEYVRQIESITNEAIAALAPFGAQQDAELSIGASHTIAVYMLPRLLPRLMQQWPGLRIHVLGGNTNDVLQALTNHQVGIALIEAPAYRPDLRVEAFGEDELALIVPPGHRWSGRPAVNAADIAQEPILMREVGSGMRQFVEEYLERNGIPRHQLRAAVDSTSTEGIIAGVEAGLGAGFVPHSALEKPLKLGSVQSIALEDGPIRRALSFALLNGPEPRGPVGFLIHLLREHSAAVRQLVVCIPQREDAGKVLVMAGARNLHHLEARRHSDRPGSADGR